jgi:uncharacterized protein (TIGR00375 family)
MNINNLVKYARIKGVTLLGTGDFTHPSWLDEIRSQLVEDDSGILKTSGGFPFILSGEISSIYMQDKKLRRIHNVVLVPDLETAEQVNSALMRKKVKIESDGRPICGIPAMELVEMLKSINTGIEIIPAHIWTPWFSLFGSKSGFDRIEDCFQDQTKHIHALETGLSSDPAMNWRLSALDKFAMVSFSDSHSFWPWRIGREATLFELENLTYDNLVKALHTKDGLVETIEVDPSYGKYHFDGHRDCNVSLEPNESKRIKNVCPVCRRELTIGVLHRVEELADREHGFVPKGARPFRSLLPLSEIISSAVGANVSSNKVWEEYNKLVAAFGSELNVLVDANEERLKATTTEKIANLLLIVRNGKVKIKPGYDGVYGEIENVKKSKNENAHFRKPQKTLGDF